MISAFLILVSAVFGFFAFVLGMVYEDEKKDAVGWTGIVFVAMSMAISFIAGALS